MSVGGPASLRLAVWAREVREFFCDQDWPMPYLVGSAVEGKQWRDVDVVVILSDDDFLAMFGTVKPPFSVLGKWATFCAAFSAWGESFTGLPIDFKVQPQTWANETHDGRREAIGIRIEPRPAPTEDPAPLPDDRPLTPASPAASLSPAPGGRLDELAKWLSHDDDCDLAEPLTDDQKARYYAETGILPPDDEVCTCGLADALDRLSASPAPLPDEQAPKGRRDGD